ncbi:MAG: serine/threonine protein kinase [Acidobacteria bacterium]|nr:MAG: serine/threonine protein kinase [Acidobacteriota bacterium]
MSGDDLDERPTQASGRTPPTGRPTPGEMPTRATVASSLGVAATEGFPVAGWDRYQFVEFLGEGGMGRVYKAFDPRLKRTVALKFLKGDDPELNRRFLQEAQAQARVEHENVCRVYEVGEVHGRLYIALPFLEGEPLSRAARQMSLEEKVRVMAQVAEGLHAAHRIGLVHRDVKPGNVIVERAEDGSLHPWVTDFGLAREAAAEGMTVTGSVVGTPWYMSPEQALGRTRLLDRRSDVFSAGVTLYEVLAGRPPFEGESPLDVMRKIVEEEPRPLSAVVEGFPVDLDTVVLKCLEKEPSRRYDSARALAEDLRRFLDGEPVVARPLSLAGRLARRARRNLPLTAALSALVLVLLVSAALAVRSALTTRARTALAQSLGQEVREVEVLMRFASHTLPRHDVTRERDVARARLSDLEKRVAHLPASLRPPGDYALGRGLLAVGEYARARERLQAAWDAGFRGPDVSYALGMTLARLYERELRGLAAAPTPEERARRKEELERSLRKAALVHLREARAVRIDAPELVTALVADLEGDFDRAAELSRRAAERVPWLYEARTMEGRALRRRADKLKDAGKDEEALGDYRRAEEAFLSAVETARSDPEAHLGLCTLYSELMDFDWKRRLPPAERFATAAEWCDRAIAVDPESALARLRASDVLWRRAEFLVAEGRDPRPDLERSIELAESTIPSGFDLSYAYDNLGIAWHQRGEWELAQGIDPRASFGKAVESYEVCLTRFPGLFSTYCNAANVLARLAGYEVDEGRDPAALLRRGREVVARGRKVSPHFCVPAGLASLELEALRHALATGADPSEPGRAVRAALAEVREKNPTHAEVPIQEARVALLLAEREVRAGGDPAGSLSEARVAVERLRALNPGARDLPLLLAEARLVEAALLLRQGRGAAARREREAALSADPSLARRRPTLAKAAGLR